MTAYERALRPERPVQHVKWMATAIVVVAMVWSLVTTDIRWSRLPGAPGELATIGRLMFEDLALHRMGDIVAAMWESIAIAWLGTVLASIVAIPLSFLAAANLSGRVSVMVTRQAFNALRAIPEIILAIAFVPIFGLSPLAGTMAIAVGSIGTLGKLNAEILEGIDPGPLEAADASGANRLQRFRWGVLPQAMPELAAFMLYRFEINIRASAVLGIVGAGGIGTILAQSITFRQWGTAGVALIVVVVGTILVDTISGAVRRRIIAGPSGGATQDHLAPLAAIAESA